MLENKENWCVVQRFIVSQLSIKLCNVINWNFSQNLIPDRLEQVLPGENERYFLNSLHNLNPTKQLVLFSPYMVDFVYNSSPLQKCFKKCNATKRDIKQVKTSYVQIISSQHHVQTCIHTSLKRLQSDLNSCFPHLFSSMLTVCVFQLLATVFSLISCFVSHLLSHSFISFDLTVTAHLSVFL